MATQVASIKWVPSTSDRRFIVDGFNFQTPSCRTYFLVRRKEEKEGLPRQQVPCICLEGKEDEQGRRLVGCYESSPELRCCAGELCPESGVVAGRAELQTPLLGPCFVSILTQSMSHSETMCSMARRMSHREPMHSIFQSFSHQEASKVSPTLHALQQGARSKSRRSKHAHSCAVVRVDFMCGIGRITLTQTTPQQ
eukprot:1160888-Pelagomonas_calceolata.AAC.8